MESRLGTLLLSGLAPAARGRFGWFARFVGTGDDSVAASKLAGCDSERGYELVCAYLVHLRVEGVDADGQRERINALATLVTRAHRLGVCLWVLDVDRVFTLAAQTPARQLLPNGGDRRSPRFQRCDQPLRRGCAGYFLARLARDRPDILAGYRRGEYRSARQAAIAAGFVRARIARKSRVSRGNSCAATKPQGGVAG